MERQPDSSDSAANQADDSTATTQNESGQTSPVLDASCQEGSSRPRALEQESGKRKTLYVSPARPYAASTQKKAVCAVGHCHGPFSPGTKRHVFPKDPEISARWVIACHREDTVNPKTARICSRHFTPDDYEKDLRQELLNNKLVLRLKKGAIPSQRLVPGEVSSSKSGRQDRLERRARRQLVSEMLGADVSAQAPNETSATEAPVIIDAPLRIEETQEEKIERLNALVLRQEKNISSLKVKVSSLRLQNWRLRRQKQKAKTLSSQQKIKIAKEVLKGTTNWSDKQIDFFLSRKQSSKWGNDDIVLGLTLRALSRKAYQLLRNKRLLPLPSLSILRKRIKHFQCTPGIQNDILRVISAQKYVLGNGSDGPIPVCLSFDEMSLSRDLQFDQATQTVHGPHDQAQVVVIRGLYKQFMQPIYFEFDKAVTKTMLFNLIDEVDAIGLQVEVIVSDLGPKNLGLWSELGIKPGNVHFDYKGRTIQVMADVPHLLKLTRNHLLDQGYVLQSGSLLEKEDLQKILATDSGELKLNHKLKPAHISCRGNQRQRVILAAQVFSRRTAKALLAVSPEKKEQADVIELINASFDVLNSRSAEGHKEYDYALGWESKFKKTTTQLEILSRAKEELGNMRVIDIKHYQKSGIKKPVKSPLPFQKGWLVSIDSAIELYEKMRAKYNASFLMTSRINQDILENLFSRIRYIAGANTHPGCVEFMNRLRLVVLGKSSEFIIATAPVEMDQDSDCGETDMILSEELLKNLSAKNEENQTEDVMISVAETTVESPTTTDCSEEAKKYLAGYIAFKLKDQFPELSEEGTIESPLDCPWIESYSFGGLTKPSSSWFERFKQFEGEFSNIHGQTILHEPNIIKKLEIHLSAKFPDIPKAVIALYSKTRIHIRIKFLRIQYKKDSEDNRNRKKMRHFST